MSPLLLRRLRGIAGTVATWTVAAGLTGAAIGAVISFAVLLPRGLPMQLPQVVGGLGLVCGAIGGVCGLGFALCLAFGERRRGLDELRAWRMGAWGALPSFALGLLASRDIGLALTFGAMGFTAAAGSLAIARRALVAGPAERPLLGE